MAIDRQQIERWFAPGIMPKDASEDPRAHDIRIQAKRLAETIMNSSPASSDQSNAIRKVREAMAAAVQSIVLVK